MPSLKLFKLFTNDASGSPPDPDTATTCIVIPFPEEMVTGESEILITHPDGMGSVFEMFDGSVGFQDFGVVSNLAGGKISFKNKKPVLTSANVVSLFGMYSATDTYYYFTDGTDYYKVRFSRVPAGFTYWKQYIVEESIGYTRYSFTMDLIIEEKLP